MSFKVSNKPLLLATFPTSPASRSYKQSSFLDTRGCAPSCCVELFVILREAIYNIAKHDKNIITNNGCLVRQFQIQLRVCSNKMYLGLVPKPNLVRSSTSDYRESRFSLL